jgi:hypothetical protein
MILLWLSPMFISPPMFFCFDCCKYSMHETLQFHLMRILKNKKQKGSLEIMGACHLVFH